MSLRTGLFFIHGINVHVVIALRFTSVAIIYIGKVYSQHVLH